MISLRKLLGLVLVGLMLVAVGNACSQPSEAQRQSEAMSALHQADAPKSSPLVAQETMADGEDITYGEIGGVPLTGYLARPADAEGPLPGLIVIQEWWGLNDNIRAMARRLADQGYAALAVDLYDDQVAETPDEARTLVQAALDNPSRLEDNLSQAYGYLEGELSASKIASIGWCFGGTWSLNTALLFPQSLDAAVIYYGGGITTERDRLQTLEMPIQGHFGMLDSNPSPETAKEFEAVLTELGKPVEVYLYEDAGHAFANPSGTRYNAQAAELAWERTTTFLKEHLQ
ncbi:MAG: dienelactone hydrolase family protein [Elainellaceae cyanobacterium]